MPLEDMLLKIAALLQYGPGDWRARAEGADKYAHGATPLEAVQAALGVRVDTLPDDNSDLF